MDSKFEKIARFLLSHRWLILIVIIAVTVYFGSYIFPFDKVRFDFSFRRLFRHEGKEGRKLVEYKELFGDDVLRIGILFESADQDQNSQELSAFNPAVLSAVKELENWASEQPELEQEQTASVLSITNLYSEPIRPAFLDGELARLLKCMPLQKAALSWSNHDFASPCLNRFLKAVKQIMKHKLYKSSFFSPDGRVVALFVRFKHEYFHPDSRASFLKRLNEKISWIQNQPQYRGKVKVYPVGIAQVTSEYERVAKQDLLRSTPLSVIIMAIIIFLSFRSLAATLLPIIVVAVGVVWGVGLMQAAGHPMNIINHVLPVVVLVVGVADAVHILARYFEERSKITDSKVATTKTISKLAIACFLTSTTTAIGFGSLFTANIPSIAYFGIFTAIAVMFTYVVNVTLLPVFMPYLPQVKTQSRFSLARFLSWLSTFTTRHYRLIFVLSLLWIAIAAVIAYNCLEVNSYLLEELPKTNQVHVNIKRAEKLLSPIIPYEVLIESRKAEDVSCSMDSDCKRELCSSQADCPASCALFGYADRALAPVRNILRLAAGQMGVKFIDLLSSKLSQATDISSGYCTFSIKDPQLLKAVDSAITELMSDPSVRKIIGKTESLLDVVKELNMAMHSADPKYYKIPDSRQAVSQLLVPVETSAPLLIERYATVQYDAMRIILLSYDKGSDAWFFVKSRLESLLHKYIDQNPRLHQMYSWHITGSMPYVEKSLSYMIHDMISSVAVAFLFIFALITVLFRSVKVGLVSVVPNIFPLLCTFVFMSVFGIPLRLATLVIFSISLGIAVNDTIHLLARYREEIRSKDIDSAIRTSLMATGKAMTVTTVILTLGFLVDIFSDFVAVVQFSYLSGFTLVCALFGDLVILPACIKLFKLRR